MTPPEPRREAEGTAASETIPDSAFRILLLPSYLAALSLLNILNPAVLIGVLAGVSLTVLVALYATINPTIGSHLVDRKAKRELLYLLTILLPSNL
jgi:hypothetical protein